MLFTLSKDQHARLQSIQVAKKLRNFHEALDWALEEASEPFREDFEAERAEQREAQREKWEHYKNVAKQRERGNNLRR